MSTFSKHSALYPEGWPTDIDLAIGCHVWNKRGSEHERFTDWSWSGTGVLGHRAKEVRYSVEEILSNGYWSTSSTHPLESEVSCLLRRLMPWAQSTRFCLNGTDALQGAVRLARAVTDRQVVAVFEGSYHGDSADWCVASKQPARGVTVTGRDDIVVLTKSASSLRNIGKIAAVVYEASEPPTPELVKELNAIHENGTLLIVDEVVTGFRVDLHGACGLFKINPDLVCYGKALGSGIPIAALCGRADLMLEFDPAHTDCPVFMSYTNAAHPLGLAAARATLGRLEDGAVLGKVKKTGQRLWNGFIEVGINWLGEGFSIKGYPEKQSLIFDDSPAASGQEIFWSWQVEMLKHKILVGKTNCPNVSHDEQAIKQTLDAARIAFKAASTIRANGWDQSMKRPLQLYAKKSVMA